MSDAREYEPVEITQTSKLIVLRQACPPMTWDRIVEIAKNVPGCLGRCTHGDGFWPLGVKFRTNSGEMMTIFEQDVGKESVRVYVDEAIDEDDAAAIIVALSEQMMQLERLRTPSLVA